VIDQTETAVRIERTVDVPAERIFAVLVDPSRHPELDGSGTVLAAREADLIGSVGQMFTMEMSSADLGDYVSENHVVEFEPGRRITWQTTRDGKTAPGFRWGWVVEESSPGRCLVTHTYDWSLVSDQAVLERVGFPRVSAAEMNTTVTRLIAAAQK
jgi:uncharacterized protein YndB with AHSA1/START domain